MAAGLQPGAQADAAPPAPAATHAAASAAPPADDSPGEGSFTAREAAAGEAADADELMLNTTQVEQAQYADSSGDEVEIKVEEVDARRSLFDEVETAAGAAASTTTAPAVRLPPLR